MSNKNNLRMMNVTEAGVYLGLGRSKTIEFCNQIGAVIHIGRRVLYDKTVIDAYFDINSRKQLNRAD